MFKHKIERAKMIGWNFSKSKNEKSDISNKNEHSSIGNLKKTLLLKQLLSHNWSDGSITE